VTAEIYGSGTVVFRLEGNLGICLDEQLFGGVRSYIWCTEKEGELNAPYNFI
jgi:hypothetical protein